MGDFSRIWFVETLNGPTHAVSVTFDDPLHRAVPVLSPKGGTVERLQGISRLDPNAAVLTLCAEMSWVVTRIKRPTDSYTGYGGLLWGVSGDGPSGDNPSEVFLPRMREDPWKVVPEPTDPPADAIHLGEGIRNLERGIEHYEGDPATYWIGFPVRDTMPIEAMFRSCGVSYALDHAREDWTAFRVHCRKTYGVDPGDGELHVVRNV